MRLLPRVLIVDDEPAIAELISINLRHNGFTPFWAEDGESAQRELDNELPDVILLGRVINHFAPALAPACGWMREARRSQ